MTRDGLPPLSETIEDRIEVRGRDLANELIGTLSFTEMLLLDLHGEEQPAAHVRLVDAVLVTLMEHGITPSTLAARIVLDGAPESMQGAVAAGLLATGSRFLGVIDDAARLVRSVCAAKEPIEEAASVRVRELVTAGQRVPGFGHNLHSREDPRVEALIALAREQGVAGRHCASLDALGKAVEVETGRALIPNAAAAVAAILSDLGYEADDIRGFALVARSAGIFAHVADERRNPVARAVWQDFHGNDD